MPDPAPADAQLAQPVIRAARPDDAAALGTLHVRSWQAAYRGLLPDAFLDALVPSERAARWRQILAAGEREVVVLEVGGRVAGFAAASAARDPDAAPGTGELIALYLDPDLWRRGLGRRLMGWTRDLARARGWQRLTLWVLRDNARARGFYEAEGFRLDGAGRLFAFGGSPVPELRYAWDAPRRA